MKDIKKSLLSFALVLFLAISCLPTCVQSSAKENENVSNKCNIQYIKGDSGEYFNIQDLELGYKPNSIFDKNKRDKYLKELDNKKSQELSKSTYTLFSSSVSATSTSKYGAAWPYEATSSTSYNCYGYASRFYWWICPGDIALYYGSPISSGSKPSVNQVADWVLMDLQRAGRSSRIISSATASVNSNEYRIALRVGSTTINGYSLYDFHFMLQTSNGQWCHKPGSTPSQLLGNINPSTYSWDLKDNNGKIVKKNFYNSNTIYIAVKR